jgi:hypothetical protein
MDKHPSLPQTKNKSSVDEIAPVKRLAFFHPLT